MFDSYIQAAKDFVASEFGGDPKAAFDHYAGSDGQINEAGIVQFLTDADIGWRFLRESIAKGVLAKLDTDGNGELSWDEIQAAKPPTATEEK